MRKFISDAQRAAWHIVNSEKKFIVISLPYLVCLSQLLIRQGSFFASESHPLNEYANASLIRAVWISNRVMDRKSF